MRLVFVTLCWGLHMHIPVVDDVTFFLYLALSSVIFTHPKLHDLAFEARTVFYILIRQVHCK